MTRCDAPIDDRALVDYWTGELSDEENRSIEEHLFSCASCAARLESIASLEISLRTLARQGRISGIISRPLLNRLQREGVRVRLYSLSPGETVPCAIFPGDDLVVTSLRADLEGIDTVSLVVTGPGNAPVSDLDDAPIAAEDGEVLWATPGAVVRQMPSTRLRLTLASGGDRRVLGEYVLDHSAAEPGS
jgi:Putative zinc-finger